MTTDERLARLEDAVCALYWVATEGTDHAVRAHQNRNVQANAMMVRSFIDEIGAERTRN
jgi:hypothetical protein